MKGLIQVFKGTLPLSDSQIHSLVDAKNIDKPDDTGYMPIDGKQYVFHAGMQEVVPLTTWMSQGKPLDRLMADSIKNIIGRLHHMRYSLGIVQGSDVLSLFGIDSGTRRISLMNWARLKVSDSPISDAFETQRVNTALLAAYN
jgi:hypothetical protein